MYEVYRLTALAKYFYVYTDKGINNFKTELEATIMAANLTLEEAKLITLALVEDRWNTTEELRVEHIDLGWNVYRFNRRGKVEYCASSKGIGYFDIEIEPVMIACDINHYDADLIANALITQIEFKPEVKDDESDTNSSRVKPKGIVPKELNDQRFIRDRFYEICEAIVEFKHAGVRIPKEWLNELDDMFLDNDTHDLLEKGIC